MILNALSEYSIFFLNEGTIDYYNKYNNIINSASTLYINKKNNIV